MASAAVLVVCAELPPVCAIAQITSTGSATTVDATVLDSLVARVLVANPAVRAAASRADAARAQMGPAGARPDPMLMAGVLNFPYASPGYGDNFTMNTVRLTQTFPFPGKLSLAEHAAREEGSAADATVGQMKLDVVREVKTAYYELAFVRQAQAITARSGTVIEGLISVAQARYAVGTAAQADVLRARVDAARLGERSPTNIGRNPALGAFVAVMVLAVLALAQQSADTAYRAMQLRGQQTMGVDSRSRTAAGLSSCATSTTPLAWHTSGRISAKCSMPSARVTSLCRCSFT